MRVYLDNNATTQPAPEVIEAMLPILREVWANPSSVHGDGRRARAALDEARAGVARFVGCDARELVFTAGGSEANALAIKGIALASAKRHLVVSAIEHPSVLAAADQLEKQGFEISRIAPDAEGVVDPAAVSEAIGPETALVSLMLANNETGALQPVVEVAARCRAAGVPLHVDAVQAAGKIALDVAALGCDLLTIAAHKFHGPKGVGALFVRRGLQLAPIIAGHQERGRRGGTESAALATGMAKACELAQAALGQMEEVAARRDRFEAEVLARIPGAARNGPATGRVPNTSNLRFEGADGETILIGLDLEGIAVSSGAACSSGAQTPSHVLRAMGQSASQAQSAIRFSLSRETTDAELEQVLAVLPRIVEESRRAEG